MPKNYISLPSEEKNSNELQRIQIFKALFNPLLESAFIYDRTGIILLINPTAVRLLGLTSEADCLGRPYHKFLHLYELSCGCQYHIENPLEKIFHAKPGIPIEMKHIYLELATKQCIPVNVYCAPITDIAQSQYGICVIHKLDEHEGQEQLLRKVVHSFLGMVDNNSSLSEFLLIDRECVNLLSSPEIKVVIQSMIDLLRHQLSSQNVRLATIDSERQHINYIAMSGVSKEEEQLRLEAAQKYPVSAWISDDQIQQLLAHRFLILTDENYLRPPEIRFNVAPQTHLYIPLINQGQLVCFLSVAKAGRKVIYSLEEIELAQAIAALIVVIARQYRLYCTIENIQASEKALRELNRSMNEFLDLASHELRTPLTIIVGNMQLSQRRLHKAKKLASNKEQKDRIENILHPLNDALEGAHVQERMINDMLDDSLIQTDTITLQQRRCDLRKIVQGTFQHIKRDHSERTLLLEEPEDDQPIMVVVDPARISRVIDTYLRNALDHSPHESPVILRLSTTDKCARVEVKDQGPGIPAKEQELLWQRFYRAKGTTIQHELDLSLGLGMYLCRAFIELHHGYVGIESAPGKGATFWFMLPLSELSQPNQQSQESKDSQLQPNSQESNQ